MLKDLFGTTPPTTIIIIMRQEISNIRTVHTRFSGRSPFTSRTAVTNTNGRKMIFKGGINYTLRNNTLSVKKVFQFMPPPPGLLPMLPLWELAFAQ